MSFDGDIAHLGRPQLANFVIFCSIVLSLLLSAFSPHPFLILACGLSFFLIVFLLWDSAGPPFLLIPALFQWSEVATIPISTVWRQVPINDLSEFGTDLISPALFGLCGVTLMAFGMWASARVTRSRSRYNNLILEHSVKSISFDRVLITALSFIVLGYFFALTSRYIGGIGVILIELGGLKYIGLFIICYWCLR